MAKSIGVAEVKRHFSEVLMEVSRDGKHFIVEKKGKPMIALVTLEDLELLKRTEKPSQKKGLLAAIAAWEECDDIEDIVARIYKRRQLSRERRVKELV